jgi:hypothetical protein
MAPNGKLASTGMCLADEGREYVVFVGSGEPFTVDLSAAGKVTLKVHWYNPRTGQSPGFTTVAGGDAATIFTPPFTGGAVLYVRHGGI